MNRFHPKTQPFDTVTQQPLHVEQAIFRTPHRKGLHCAFFAPLHYEKNYAYPLLIWLHGPGDDERQLQRVMPLISMRNYVAIGLRGPRRADTGGQGYTWTQNDSDVVSAEHGVFECLDMAAERFHVANHRIFLAGYQTGGTMAFRLGMKYPSRFAGVLSLSGAFPVGKTPLLYLDQARKLPLFVAQGRDSKVYPVERTCEELRLFHTAGMHVTLRQYPCGDELNTQMLHDMNAWLMEQVTGISSSSTEDISPLRGEEN